MEKDSITFKARLEKFSGDLWGHHIVVPDEVALPLIKAGRKRNKSLFDGSIETHSALMPMGDGSYFININKDIRSKLGLRLGSTLTVTLSPDTSKYGMEMPEEFQVLLDQDQEGAQWFHALTPGRQRSLIYIVAKYKNPDKRLEKANVILEFLKWNQGKLDFKALNQAFKDANK